MRHARTLAALALAAAAAQAGLIVVDPASAPGSRILSEAIDAPASAVQQLAEPARSIVLPAPVSAGAGGTLAVDGEPGELALLLLSTRSALIPLPAHAGSLALDPDSLAGPIALGLLDGPDGEFELPFVLGPLPPGVEATTVLVQGLFLDAEGASLGGASALTWIDAKP